VLYSNYNQKETYARKTTEDLRAGHKFYKSSDYPTCPRCAAQDKPESGFLSLLSAPAKNAL